MESCFFNQPLIGGFNPSEKLVSWDEYGKKKCSKPPTRLLDMSMLIILQCNYFDHPTLQMIQTKCIESIDQVIFSPELGLIVRMVEVLSFSRWPVLRGAKCVPLIFFSRDFSLPLRFQHFQPTPPQDHL